MKNYGTTQESGVVLRVALTRSSGRSFFLLSVPSQFFCSLTCELDAFCCEIGRNRIPQDKASRTELPGIFLCLRALKCCTGRTYTYRRIVLHSLSVYSVWRVQWHEFVNSSPNPITRFAEIIQAIYIVCQVSSFEFRSVCLACIRIFAIAI